MGRADQAALPVWAAERPPAWTLPTLATRTTANTVPGSIPLQCTKSCTAWRRDTPTTWTAPRLWAPVQRNSIPVRKNPSSRLRLTSFTCSTCSATTASTLTCTPSRFSRAERWNWKRLPAVWKWAARWTPSSICTTKTERSLLPTTTTLVLTP